MLTKVLVCFILAVEVVVMVSGAGEVITGATASASTTACAAGAAGNPCVGSLRLCANTVAPASSGTCATFAADNTVVQPNPLSYTFSNANLAALGLTLPGTYVVSARQDVTANNVVNTGTEQQQTITIPSTGTVTTNFNNLVNAAAGANPFAAAITSTTTCSCGTSGTTCTDTETTDTDVSTTSEANSS